MKPDKFCYGCLRACNYFWNDRYIILAQTQWSIFLSSLLTSFSKILWFFLDYVDMTIDIIRMWKVLNFEAFTHVIKTYARYHMWHSKEKIYEELEPAKAVDTFPLTSNEYIHERTRNLKHNSWLEFVTGWLVRSRRLGTCSRNERKR